MGDTQKEPPALVLRREVVTVASQMLADMLVIIQNHMKDLDEQGKLVDAKPGNLVMQLQKLVQTNALLSKQVAQLFPPDPELDPSRFMSQDDIALLREWLADEELMASHRVPVGSTGPVLASPPPLDPHE